MTPGMKLVLLLAEIVTLGSAIIVAVHPNILYSAVFLLFALLGVAVMYLFAGADFLGGAQIVVYVGGVTILILFAIMLTQWMYQLKLRDVRNKFVIPALVVTFGIVPFLFKGLKSLAPVANQLAPEKVAEFAGTPKTFEIGKALLGSHLLPFEAITILLLGAMVGAVWLARPRA